MNNVTDLQELVELSERELERYLGNDTSAKLLWSFLHTQSTVTAKQSKPRKKH